MPKLNIPNNLEEATEQLKQHTKPEHLEMLKKIPKGGLATYHSSLGRNLRNDWGLWTGSPLKDYMRSLGLEHADDMSGLIVNYLWCDLNGEALDIHKEVDNYRNHWYVMQGKQPYIEDVGYKTEWNPS